MVDVVITSLSGFISALITACLAYFVATLQIQSAETIKEKENLQNAKSSLFLLNHEISFNWEELSLIAQRNLNYEDDTITEDLLQFFKTHLSDDIWSKTSFKVIEHTQKELFNEIVSFYNNLKILKNAVDQKLIFKCLQQSGELKIKIEQQIKDLS